MLAGICIIPSAGKYMSRSSYNRPMLLPPSWENKNKRKTKACVLWFLKSPATNPYSSDYQSVCQDFFGVEQPFHRGHLRPLEDM